MLTFLYICKHISLHLISFVNLKRYNNEKQAETFN
jgi:hypothetical protein